MNAPSEGGGRREDPRARGGLGPQRLRVVLLVLTVFGVPLVLMLSYVLMRDAAFRPPFDEQPGGTLAGSVSFEDGSPAAGVRVQALVHPRDGRPEPYAEARTDAQGAFAIDVPPLDGCYVVVAGGGTWVETAREASLADAAPPELDFVLQPGCELTLRLARRDGGPIRGGGYRLVRAGRSLGLPLPSAAITGRFDGGELVRGGLRPGSWTLTLELDDGTELEMELDLKPGRRELALDSL